MNDNRLHYMDNLRAFAMLLGVVFHAALAYSTTLHQVWLPADSNHSNWIDVFFNFSHLFRMPLFFLVAGFFASLLYEKRGLAKLLKNRLVRVTVPFLVFLPVVTALIIASIVWAVENVENKTPMLAMIASFWGNPDAPKPPPSMMHLWFLYYLTVFYILTALAVKLGRINFGHINLVSWILKKPLLFVVLAPLCLAPALVLSGTPYPAPEQFIPKLWACWFFGFFYLLGWVFYRHGAAVELFRPYWKAMLIAGLGLFAVFAYLVPNDPMTFEQAMALAAGGPEISFQKIILAVLGAYVTLYMVLVMLIIGKDFFDKRSAAVKLIADSSYWIYLIHIPIIFAIQFALMDVSWPLWAEFTLSALGAFAVGFITYLLLVRWTPIGWLLNGRKKRGEVLQVAAAPNAANVR